ncbi:invasion associated locus B family protein [Xinfangfangia sp. D13-10-4-6]|uniref:invasion associated locus B family protein n=1 Tax=Pseudogemmobacter hezensis TaxID=2737662 RepID=UPI0015537600|nr:invasion associated locus B family protein [Pseudogemmobacter hezensis]NPD13627.1 invasion associated locus B family protein [Pseudogemmobacter hezensis]
MLKSRISLLAFVVALGAPVAAFAQDATAEAAPEAPASTEAPAAPAVDLSMGSDVGGQAESSVYTKATFEAWEQRCEKVGLEADPCQLYQLLKDADGSPVAELAIFTLPEGAPGPAVAGANFIAPLETLLTEGMQLTVDTGKPRAYPFTVCTQIGCVARIGFTAEEIAGFKKGATATFSISPFVAPDQKVNLPVSLKGFTAGYDAMHEANKLADAAATAARAAAPAAPAAAE